MLESTNPLAAADSGAPRSVAEVLGQVVWLLTQSPAHRTLQVGVLEWSFLPAIVHQQIRIFRFGPVPENEPLLERFAGLGATRETLEELPLGVAIWAKLSERAEAKLENGERLTAAEWNSGNRIWLVELISPFATVENKMVEVMLSDLKDGPFKDQTFSFHRTDPTTGVRKKLQLGPT